jgi:hypothetical protein
MAQKKMLLDYLNDGLNGVQAIIDAIKICLPIWEATGYAYKGCDILTPCERVVDAAIDELAPQAHVRRKYLNDLKADCRRLSDECHKAQQRAREREAAELATGVA